VWFFLYVLRPDARCEVCQWLVLSDGTRRRLVALFNERDIPGVDALDPVTFVIAALLLGTGAIIGAYWPVRRALSVDPIASLRKE
jgi:hypothetical protein